jgi:hypothetical protein
MMIAMEDCPMAQSHQSSGDTFNDIGKGHDCKACELCMSISEGPARSLTTSLLMLSWPLLTDVPSFISNLPLPPIKPPIA